MKKMYIAALLALLATPELSAQDCALGTRLKWESSIDEAAIKARKEGKLVLVLHVSGQFDKPEFT